MRNVVLAITLLVAACGGSQPAPGGGGAVGDTGGSGESAAATGDVGAVCRCGNQGQASPRTDCAPVACKEGLVCGYGCGVEGCDSTCMTGDENERAHQIP